ncbi:SixA phosphatase family protein [Nguyenibacter vanlangensis]|uniref:Histidine phosphatase family protein n=1 Tax=Nguyenibacter vanlangensis TaxID=1216886 RepID=A0A7Y7M5X8_9PROT|nr:histidine phosphatase family protein [Nguyenibacter vanlangensis]NVN10299.1 histidine phosphatase family protein [Nguyenibacter vanlangensis]
MQGDGHDDQDDDLARTLVLMRHAEAARDEHGAKGDLARPLTPAGRRDAHVRGTQLRDIGFVPDLVLVSPAVRSAETYDALGPLSAGPAPLRRTEAGLYENGPDGILEVLRLAPEKARNIIVVGHNPDLYQLVLDLAGKSVDDPDKAVLARGFPTLATVFFGVRGPWHKLKRKRVSLTRVLCD